jgi:hypothetical protein
MARENGKQKEEGKGKGSAPIHIHANSPRLKSLTSLQSELKFLHNQTIVLSLSHLPLSMLCNGSTGYCKGLSTHDLIMDSGSWSCCGPCSAHARPPAASPFGWRPTEATHVGFLSCMVHAAGQRGTGGPVLDNVCCGRRKTILMC